MDDNLIRQYISGLYECDIKICEDIRKVATSSDVPIISRDVAAFIKLIIALKKPHKILELGTAIGYSSIMMASITDADTHIITVEDWEPRIPIAKDNISKAGYSDKITIIKGDADDVIDGLYDKGYRFDMIFQDDAKGQYLGRLSKIISILDDNGVLITDDVLYKADTAMSRYICDRRNRTIHKRMREYLYKLTHNDKLATSILQVGDGIAITVKK